MGIPEGIREVIGRRLSRLSEDCNRVLTTASAISGGFSWTVLRAVTAEADDALANVLDEALGSQILLERSGDGADTYDFTHAMIRHTLYEELSAPRRALLHKQIGEAFERLYAENVEPHLGELAHHFYAAARATDVNKAINYATRAGDRDASLFAFEEAAGHYERALQCLELKEGLDAPAECDLLLRLADAYAKEGDIPGMRTTFLKAADAARRLGEPHQLARAAIGLGSGEDDFIGEDPPLVALLDEAVSALGDETSPLKAMAQARLAGALINSANADRAFELSREAIETARGMGDPATLVCALNAYHSALLSPDDLAERTSIATEAAELSAGTTDKIAAWYAHDELLADLLELGDIQGVDAEIETLGQLAEELRQPYWAGATIVARTMRAILGGRFEEAERLIEQAKSTGEKLRALPLAFYSDIQLFAVRREQGRLGEMEDLIQTWVAGQDNLGRSARLLTPWYMELGLVAEARREFEVIAANDFGDLPRDSVWLNTLCVLAEVCAFLDDKARAQTLYDLLLPYCSRNVAAGDVSCLGSAGRYLGVLATTLSRWQDAARHFDQALTMNAKMGAAPFLAHTQYDCARMLIAQGDPQHSERVHTLVGETRDAAQRLGMRVLARRAAALTPSSGLRSGGRPR
jgi:tetratricopeptide (TPR) repeat protein